MMVMAKMYVEVENDEKRRNPKVPKTKPKIVMTTNNKTPKTDDDKKKRPTTLTRTTTRINRK